MKNTIKLTSIEDAVRSGPFRRFSRLRAALLKELYCDDTEQSGHTDDALIAKLTADISLDNLQRFLDLLMNPALAYIKYREFIISTPTQADVDELKGYLRPYIVRPGVMHKGTMIEPIAFKGRSPIEFRVVAYDDLIPLLTARYSPDNTVVPV